MIDQVRGHFVPVAVNLYKIRESGDDGGALFRSVQRQQPQYQGIWIVSPSGKVLAAHHEIKEQARWTEEVLATIHRGLTAFGPTSPRAAGNRNPLPHRGIGVQPNGAVTLALYSRYVRGGGRSQAPASANPASLWLWDGPIRADGPPVIDSLDLSRDEYAAFSPPHSRAGAEWSLPGALARKFARVLSPNSDQSTMPRPDEASIAELHATLVGVEGGQARISLRGRYEIKHLYECKASHAWAVADGIVVFDIREKKPRSLVISFRGSYRMAPPWDQVDRPIGAVAEWKSQ